MPSKQQKCEPSPIADRRYEKGPATERASERGAASGRYSWRTAALMRPVIYSGGPGERARAAAPLFVSPGRRDSPISLPRPKINNSACFCNISRVNYAAIVPPAMGDAIYKLRAEGREARRAAAGAPPRAAHILLKTAMARWGEPWDLTGLRVDPQSVQDATNQEPA